MSQIYLFTGKNHYLLHREKSGWIRHFTQKHGEENLLRLEAKKVRVRDILDEIASAPFIASKRLVVIEGIPKMEKEDMEMIASQIHPDVLVAFAEPKPDKRYSAVKLLLNTAKIMQFDPLPRGQLLQWMDAVLAEAGSSIEPEAKQHLLAVVGEDQVFLVQELRKLALFAGNRPITERDIEEMVVCAGEQVSWYLMDYIAAGNTKKAIRYARNLMEKGSSPHALWAQLLWMVSSLVAIAAAVREGQTNPGWIMKNTGVKFGAIRSLMPLARRIDPVTLQAVVERFAEADTDLKTGNLRATAEAPQELEALIDRCLLSLTV